MERIASDSPSESYGDVLRAIARTPDADREESLVGLILDGKYRVDAPLGRGGMGTVYVATHLGTGRAVALKVLVPDLTLNAAAVERFRREARAAGLVRHPNVVDVTDFGLGEREGRQLAYLVMELLQGQTLRAVLADQRLPLAVAIGILDQICAAVAHSHALGILHRDIKPENIHLEPDGHGGYRAKVLDFGIAKLLSSPEATERAPREPDASPFAEEASLATTLPASIGGASVRSTAPGAASAKPSAKLSPADLASPLTVRGAAIGTPRYMAPEQWLGGDVDERSDVYSLGVVAYEMLVGEHPFRGAPPFMGGNQEIASLGTFAAKAPSVPRSIARAVEAALANAPSRRPSSVSMFAAALRAGTETPGKLLRRSIALCLEHYGALLRPAAIFVVPALLLRSVSLASSLLASAHLVPPRADSLLGLSIAALTPFLAAVLAPALTGLIVPIVADLETRSRVSHRPPTLSEVWRVVQGTFPSSLVKSVAIPLAVQLAVVWAMKASRTDLRPAPMRVACAGIILVTMTAAVAPFVLTGPVVAIERLRGLAPLRRSVSLLRPLLRTAFVVLTVWYVADFALTTCVNIAVAAISGSRLLDSFAAGDMVLVQTTAWRCACMIELVVSLPFAPFVLAAVALLYLRAREAEGPAALKQ